MTLIVVDKPQPSYNLLKRDKITANERRYVLNRKVNT